MQRTDLYLISGVFFQEREGITLGYDFEQGEGVIPFIERGVCEFLYIGVIQPDPTHALNGYMGWMLDPLGYARLNNVILSDENFSFAKNYENGRPHIFQINYRFRRENERYWTGEYQVSNPATPREIRGPTRCLLTPVTPDFFQHNLDIPHTRRSLVDALVEDGALKVVEE